MCLSTWSLCLIKGKWIISSWTDCHVRWFRHTNIRPVLSPPSHFWYNSKPILPCLYTHQDWACSRSQANGVSGQSPKFVVPGLDSHWTALGSVWAWTVRFGLEWSTYCCSCWGVIVFHCVIHIACLLPYLVCMSCWIHASNFNWDQSFMLSRTWQLSVLMLCLLFYVWNYMYFHWKCHVHLIIRHSLTSK